MNRLLPAGAQTYSKHPRNYAPGVGRALWAEGAHVAVEYEGQPRKLVDLTSGMGAVLLGHGDRRVTRAIEKQLRDGIAFPLPTYLEEIVAERLISMLTWKRAESVRYGKNGADVTTSAVRLARAVTGRQLVVYCDYHGHHDWCMIEPPKNGGVTNARNATRRVADRTKLIEAVIRYKPAAVVLEAYPSNGAPTTDGHPRFWDRLRQACDAYGTLLVLDEMVTGFRCAPGGAAQLEGIEPDLACYGKAMANGMPLSAIVGPWEYMRRYDDDVFFSTTHGGEALSLAAALATLKAASDGSLQRGLASLGQQVHDVLRAHGGAEPAYPQRMILRLTPEQKTTLLEYGVLCAGYANWTEAHIAEGGAILAAFRALADG